MAWSDVQPEQMVSFNDAASGGFPLNSGQSHSYTGQCMTKNDILTKYNMFSSFAGYASNQLVEKKRWSSVSFSSWYTGSGTSPSVTSTSGTVTIVGANIEFKAFATIFTGSGATCTVNINIGGNYRTAIIASIGSSYSFGFTLGPGTYSYSVSCSLTGANAIFQGGISIAIV